MNKYKIFLLNNQNKIVKTVLIKKEEERTLFLHMKGTFQTKGYINFTITPKAIYLYDDKFKTDWELHIDDDYNLTDHFSDKLCKFKIKLFKKLIKDDAQPLARR